VSEDLLDALLRTALEEPGTLDARTRREFAEALRARAALILAERIQTLEERAAAFEKEAAWRAEEAAGLEKELLALRRLYEKEKADLLAEKEHWTRESERRQANIETLERERLALADEKRVATDAHDRLLAHHRATLLRLAEALEPLPAALPWSFRRVRAKLAELVAALRRETP
jgi:hypothetical protein